VPFRGRPFRIPWAWSTGVPRPEHTDQITAGSFLVQWPEAAIAQGLARPALVVRPVAGSRHQRSLVQPSARLGLAVSGLVRSAPVSWSPAPFWECFPLGLQADTETRTAQTRGVARMGQAANTHSSMTHVLKTKAPPFRIPMCFEEDYLLLIKIVMQSTSDPSDVSGNCRGSGRR
jgi:hypothetical protein